MSSTGFCRCDGVRWIATRCQPHFGPAGELQSFMGVSTDIATRKLAEQTLRTSETRLASAAELAGLGFYELDFQAATTTYADDRCCALCGLQRAQDAQLLDFWMERLHPDDRQQVLEKRELLHSGKVEAISVEYRLLHPTRGERWIRHLARVAARDGTGRATRAYGVLCDVTDRRRAENALRERMPKSSG